MEGCAVTVDDDVKLEENVAGLLCYLGLWVTGLIFLLIDKRPFVRFHAAQSIAVFGGLQLLSIVFSLFFGSGRGFSPAYTVMRLIELVGVVLWILLMVKAFQHEKFKLPIVGQITDALLRQA